VTDLNPDGDSFPASFTVRGGVLYFTATTPGTGNEIWKYDGKSVTLAADVNEGAGDSFPQILRSVNGKLLFRATADGLSDWETWILDEGVPMNQAPTVALTAPAAGTTLKPGEQITLAQLLRLLTCSGRA
jgi:ELWxxDGT repeat protein